MNLWKELPQLAQVNTRNRGVKKQKKRERKKAK